MILLFNLNCLIIKIKNLFIIYNWSIKIKIMPNKKSTNKEINEEEKEIIEAEIEEEISKSENTKKKSSAKNREKNKEEEFDKEDVEQNKYIAVFSYLSFLFLIPLLLKRDSIFCQKHAKQGLVWFAFLILTSFIYLIPLLNIFYGLMVLFITLYSFVQTLAGKYWRIPVLYKWAEKINL